MADIDLTASSFATLNAAIQQANADTTSGDSYTITFTATIAETADLTALNLHSGVSVTIDGGNDALDGAGYSALHVSAGDVTLQNLTIENAVAQGGAGSSGGGGGGAGLGGGLFVGSGGTVALANVSFGSNSAIGGNGGGSGGDIFVQQGGSLTIEGGTLGAGTVTGGAGANSGAAYGSAIFLQGTQTQTLAPAAGATLTIAGVIADENGSVNTTSLGAGGLMIDGAGTVDLTAANSFTGGVTITAGMLVLGNAAAAGSGAITFGSGDPPDLQFTIANTPTNTIAGFVSGGTIDITDLAFNPGATAASIVGGDTLSITNGTTTVTLTLASGDYSADLPFATTDGTGGTDVGLADLSVGSFAALNEAISAVDAQTTGSYTITVTGSITETTYLTALDLASGVSVTIDGGGFTLDGGGAYRGLFVYAGNVTIENLKIQDAHAVGGAGGAKGVSSAGGGGGAGLGGGLFVASAGTVTLSAVAFAGDSATGGAGGVPAGGSAGRGAAGGYWGIGAGGGIGGGSGGFGGGGGAAYFVLDAGLSPLTHHAIEVRFADGGAALDNAPLLLTPAQPFDDGLAHAFAAAVDAAEEPGRVLDFLAAQIERVRQRRADAEAQRDARAAHLRSRRRWGADPAEASLRALVIADGMPPLLAELHALCQLGYAVS
jgi:hypothetical protein